MIDWLIDKDIQLFIYLNSLGSVYWDGFWLILTNKFSAIPLYFILVYIIYKYFGLRKTILLVLLVAIMIFFSDQTSNLFKYSFKRLRPCHDETISSLMRLVKERCGGLYAFFSAHAANSMAIAVFFSFLLKSKFKYIPYFLIFWALLVAYSRIYIGVHFPLDVLTGVAFGVFYGFIFYKLYQFFLVRLTQ
ncbi:phosphatase PAP2 family protein [Lutibacter sp.]|uniref:phosphatase PAP2 family protein n=1 Tax=Lutibacter sp. TaxID=1925666 RepID=UPI002735AA39|nr:phosphatase PAP2 family protein [Lutibacter sp.]MDP3311804.1 phosphatase PAP2 family protein [Lutibacter sp.]